MQKAIVLYVPVIHQGYLGFFERHSDVDTIYIMGNDLISELMPLHKEIRALAPEQIREMLIALGVSKNIEILTKENIDELDSKEIITASESISKKLIETYFPNNNVDFDTIFLRWDEANVFSGTSVKYDRISEDPRDIELINQAASIKDRSSCWWRQLGALAVRDGKELLHCENNHVPSEHINYINGDPRDHVKAGTNSEIATTLHAEQKIIVEAARRGIALEGADLYLTVFPCPMCAKLIAYSGIKRVFFSSGHASLDGESVMRAKGVEMIFVKLNPKE